MLGYGLAVEGGLAPPLPASAFLILNSVGEPYMILSHMDLLLYYPETCSTSLVSIVHMQFLRDCVF